MQLLKLPRLSRRSAGVSGRQVGEALVVHGKPGLSKQAAQLASSLRAEADHVLVVADFPTEGASIEVWKAVAAALPPAPRAVRLFPAATAREIPLSGAQWLADRLGAPVLFPDGAMQAGPTGLVFLPPHSSRGWTVCAPGQPPERRGRRFPVPEWERTLDLDLHRAGEATTAEPLPAGLWLRPHGPESWLQAGRARLTRWLRVSTEELTVVLGAPGVPALPLADVARWWTATDPDARNRARFFRFGELDAAGEVSPGQALADALGEEIVCYGGVPTGSADAGEMFALRPDGSHGVPVFADQVAFRPRHDVTAEPAAPRIRRSRPPADGLIEARPGLYQHSSGVVVEVVQAGLWVRPQGEPAHAATVRTASVDPDTVLVFHDSADDGLAAAILEELPGKVRAVAKLVPIAVPEELPRGPFGVDLTKPLHPLPRLSRLMMEQSEIVSRLAGLPETGFGARSKPDDAMPAYSEAAGVTTRISHPAVTTLPAPRASRPEAPKRSAWAVQQAVADPAARVWPVPAGFVVDETVVRDGREAEFDALSERVGAVVRRFSADRGARGSRLTAVVAAGLYLAGRDPDVDAGLLAGTIGSHVEFGRCVACGLEKLPMHRKATATVLDLDGGLWPLLTAGTVLVERGFVHTRTTLGPAESGSTDLVVWSLSGRLTASIEPSDGTVAGRVLFPPGTRFRVLEAVEPGEKRRGRILLRELAASEVGDGGSRDDLVRASLQAFADRNVRAAEPVPDAELSRFARVPGVAAVPVQEASR
ncbi:hypothetical protein [Amycolatopsis sp. lyj-23]|uniref:hypothetical protein n=1 Tax=Amycolatopsis sp. lyj-23 TaxID=2789283 RepID=UPI003978D97E